MNTQIKRIAVCLVALLILAGCSAPAGKTSAPSETTMPPSASLDQANPAAAVQLYFGYAAKGDFQSAWALIHPTGQKYPWDSTGKKLQEQFLAQKPGPTLVSATEGKRLDEYKFYVNQLMQLDVATVDVKLSDNTQKTLHLLKTGNGKWCLFWDEGNGLE